MDAVALLAQAATFAARVAGNKVRPRRSTGRLAPSSPTARRLCRPVSGSTALRTAVKDVLTRPPARTSSHQARPLGARRLLAHGHGRLRRLPWRRRRSAEPQRAARRIATRAPRARASGALVGRVDPGRRAAKPCLPPSRRCTAFLHTTRVGVQGIFMYSVRGGLTGMPVRRGQG